MKKKLMTAALLCSTLLLGACGGSDGEGDDHATQNENADFEGTTETENDMTEDTTMTGDTTTTM
ncbi:hypothetical protein WG947_14210 [Pontibacter sp. H259]|uniref:hypothetical protein n=1 Tax=Pontibacter sp. H259 TaxID=3133421 RepID=UPI0030C4A15D